MADFIISKDYFNSLNPETQGLFIHKLSVEVGDLGKNVIMIKKRVDQAFDIAEHTQIEAQRDNQLLKKDFDNFKETIKENISDLKKNDRDLQDCISGLASENQVSQEFDVLRKSMADGAKIKDKREARRNRLLLAIITGFFAIITVLIQQNSTSQSKELDKKLDAIITVIGD